MIEIITSKSFDPSEELPHEWATVIAHRKSDDKLYICQYKGGKFWLNFGALTPGEIGAWCHLYHRVHHNPPIEYQIDKHLRDRVEWIRQASDFYDFCAENDLDTDGKCIYDQIVERRRDGVIDKEEARYLFDEAKESDLLEAENSIERVANDILEARLRHKVYDVLMSFGGPSDRFQVYTDSDGGIDRIDYVYSWWGSARRELRPSQEADIMPLLNYLGIGEWQ